MARQRILSQSSTYKWKINPNDIEGLADGMAEDYTTRSSIQNDLDSIMSTEFDQMRGNKSIFDKLDRIFFSCILFCHFSY